MQVVPKLLEQIVKVPPMVSRYRDAVRDLVDDVQLLDRYLVNLVQQVDARDVDSVSLDNVNQIVGRGVVSQRDVRVVDLVLGQDRADEVEVELALRDERLEVDAALVLLAEDDVWRFLVEPDPVALQLSLDDPLVPERLENVQDDEDEAAGPGDGDDLATSALAVLGAFDDAGQIQQLEN